MAGVEHCGLTSLSLVKSRGFHGDLTFCPATELLLSPLVRDDRGHSPYSLVARDLVEVTGTKGASEDP